MRCLAGRNPLGPRFIVIDAARHDPEDRLVDTPDGIALLMFRDAGVV